MNAHQRRVERRYIQRWAEACLAPQYRRFAIAWKHVGRRK